MKKILRQQKRNIYINEHLTKRASDLYYKARKLVKNDKIFAAWTRNGQVFIKQTKEQLKPIFIKSVHDLPG